MVETRRSSRRVPVKKAASATSTAIRHVGGSQGIAALVAQQMPGWELALDPAMLTPPPEDSMKSEKGPSIEQLRRKFLGATDVAADAGNVLGDVDASVQTVRVQPKRGGPAKTADIKNGKISIVQG